MNGQDQTPDINTASDQSPNLQNQPFSAAAGQGDGQTGPADIPDGQQTPPPPLVTDQGQGQGTSPSTPTSPQQPTDPNQPLAQQQDASATPTAPPTGGQPDNPSVEKPNPDGGSSGDSPPTGSSGQQGGSDGGGTQPTNSGGQQGGDGKPDVDNTLLNDPAFQVLHGAFLLGWNLLELRSRILLAALDMKFQQTHDQVAAFALVDSILDTLLPGQRHDTTAAEIEVREQSDIEQQSLLPTSFPGLLNSSAFEKLPVEPSDAVWNTSVWRAMFNRIVALQNNLVKTSNTTGTIYDVAIPGQTPSDDPQSPYSYLYIPKTVADTFTSIGISGSDTVQYPMSNTFRLYDITRRTLNCLTQLYVKPDEVLNPSTLTKNRDAIVSAILGAEPSITPKSSGASSADDVRVAIKRCTGLTVRFLEAWDGYVRESFYVGHNYENYEIDMIAYEAGRALSTLSWGVALFVVPLENALDDTSLSKTQHIVLMQQLYAAWQSVFNTRDVIHIQHQISALSNAIDGAYFRTKNATPQNQLPDQHLDPSNGNDDPCLPSNALHCIKQSLDYWQAAIRWIGSPRAQKSIRSAHNIVMHEQGDTPMMSKELSSQLRIALIEQADVWQSLTTGQQTLQSIMTEEVTQGILSKFMQDCEKAFMSDMTNDVRKEVEEVKKNTEQLLWRNRILLMTLLAIAIILLILFAAAEFIAIQSNGQPGNSWLGNAIVTLASFLGVGFVVHRATQTTPTTPQTSPLSSTERISGQPAPQTNAGSDAGANNSSMLDRVHGFFVASGTEISDLFSACSREIQKQYDKLNRNASVSYPLIEVFVMNSQPKTAKKKENMTPLRYDFGVNDSYSFLTSVIWTNEDREEEIQSIVRATFGPLGELIGSTSSQFRNQGGGDPSSPSPSSSG